MNDLLNKYNEYKRLKNYRIEYMLANGLKIEYFYREENFVHLLGLHKLDDLQLVQFFNDTNNKMVNTKYVIRRIKQERFTDSMVRASVNFHEIEERYERFSYDNLTTITYTDAVIDFDPTLIPSKIKSDYLLFEEKGVGKYNHLGLALDASTGTRYIETYFHRPDNAYIAGQTVVKVSNFTLYDAENKVIVCDKF